MDELKVHHRDENMATKKIQKLFFKGVIYKIMTLPAFREVVLKPRAPMAKIHCL